MAALAGSVLIMLALPALVVSAYFTTLGSPRLSRLAGRLGRLLGRCGIETGSCATLADTPQARLLAGVPNGALGIAWAVALLGLALGWIVSGRIEVPHPYLLVAAASLLMSAYLLHALLFVLRRRCPL